MSKVAKIIIFIHLIIFGYILTNTSGLPPNVYAASQTSWDFSTAGNTEGWTATHVLSYSVSGGIFYIDPSTENDPYITSPSISVSASSYNAIRIKMASNATDGTGDIYFITSSSTTWNESKKVSFRVSNHSLAANAPYSEYIVYMAGNSNWSGTITGIRLDPAVYGASGNSDTIGIDYIKFENVTRSSPTVDLSFTKDSTTASSFTKGDTQKKWATVSGGSGYTVNTYVQMTQPDETPKYAYYSLSGTCTVNPDDTLYFSTTKTPLLGCTWEVKSTTWNWNTYTFTGNEAVGTWKWEFWYEDVTSPNTQIAYDSASYTVTSTPTCTYSISPTSKSFTSSGGTGSVSVSTSNGCSWTATSNISWITITSGSSGSGNGTVYYSVSANTSTTQRTGTMTIAGQTFTVTQEGAPTPTPTPTPTSSTSWDFNTAGDTEGWTTTHVSSYSVSGGIFYIDPSTENDPYITSPSISVSAASYNAIRIKMASNATDGTGDIYFITSSSTTWNESKKVSFRVSNHSLAANAPYSEYIVYMAGNSNWSGTITGIRLDPAVYGASGNSDTIGIDYIKFENVTRSSPTVDLSFTKDSTTTSSFTKGDTQKKWATVSGGSGYTVNTYVKMTQPDETPKYAYYSLSGTCTVNSNDTLYFSTTKTPLLGCTWEVKNITWNWNTYTFTGNEAVGTWKWEFWYEDVTSPNTQIAYDSASYTVTTTPTPTDKPTGYVTINNGATYTTSTTVTLSLLATDDVGVTGYYVSTSSSKPSTSASGWTSVSSTPKYSGNVSFALSSGDGTKTVYAWYKDAAGNTSDTASDSIILDTTAPTVTITSPTSSSTYTTTSSTISLSGSASDSTSGVSSVTWSNDRGVSGTASGTTSWSISNISLSSGDNVITVTAKDKAGNTGTDTITIIYENVSTPTPTPTPTITPIPTPIPSATPKTETPKFLTLPLKENATVINGWYYSKGYAPIGTLHKGIDYESSYGQEIIAAADGVAMASSQYSNGDGYGKFVLIKHDEKNINGENYFTLYAHVSSVVSEIKTYSSNEKWNTNYSEWTPVKRGEVIAYVGNEDTSWTHLHFEINIGGYAKNKTDPYDLADKTTTAKIDSADYYPPSGSLYTSCGTNYLWTTDPPSLNDQDKRLITADGETIYWLQNNRIYHIINPEILNAMEDEGVSGWSWSSINTVSGLSSYTEGPEFMAAESKSNGLLIREIDTDSVYMMDNGLRRHITSQDTLKWMGDDWNADVIEVPSVIITDYVSKQGDDIYAVGEGESDPSIKDSFKDAYTRNADDSYCTSSSDWKGWPDQFSSCLGFPISKVEDAYDSGVSGISGKYQDFDNGVIEWTEQYGAFEVHGAIFTKYKELGYSSSDLGFPVRDEYQWGSYRRSDFEGGYIYWNSSTDKTYVIYTGGEKLLEKYAPILYMHSEEQFYPTKVEIMLENSELYKKRTVLGDKRFEENPTLEMIMTEKYNKNKYYLMLKKEAKEKLKDKNHWKKDIAVYGRKFPKDGKTILQYWFFYIYNDWDDIHEGDWEMIQIVLDNDKSDEYPVTYSVHKGGIKLSWDKVEKYENTDHPKVYVTLGGHGSWNMVGENGDNIWHQKLGTCLKCIDKTSGDGDVLVPEEMLIISNKYKSYKLIDVSDSEENNSAYHWLHWKGYWGKQRDINVQGKTKYIRKRGVITDVSIYLQVKENGPKSPPYIDYIDDEYDGRWKEPLIWKKEPNPSNYTTCTSDNSKIITKNLKGNKVNIPFEYCSSTDDGCDKECSKIKIVYSEEDLVFDIYSLDGEEVNLKISRFKRTTGEVYEVEFDWLEIPKEGKATFIFSSEQNPNYEIGIDRDLDGSFDSYKSPDYLEVK